MKQYNVGNDYLVLTVAARYMADKIGKRNNERVIDKIYKEFRRRIVENKFEHEHLGTRIIKVKKSFLDSLVGEFRSMFSEYYQLSLLSTEDMKKGSVDDSINKLELKPDIGESKNEHYEDNLILIKDLLNGKYDDLVDAETKRKLIQRLLESN